MTDMINHPPHYTSHPAGIECIDVIEWFPANIACAMKYLWRAGLKVGKTQEVEVTEVYADIGDD